MSQQRLRVKLTALISDPPADPSSLSPEQAQAVAARASIAAQQKLIEATTTEGAADIAAAQAHIEAADAALVAAQAQLALSEVRAPSAGAPAYARFGEFTSGAIE